MTHTNRPQDASMTHTPRQYHTIQLNMQVRIAKYNQAAHHPLVDGSEFLIKSMQKKNY